MNNHQQIQLTGHEVGLDIDDAADFNILVDFPDGSVPLSDEPMLRRRARGVGSAFGKSQKSDPTDQIEKRSVAAVQTAMSTIREMALQMDLMRQGIPGGSQPRMVKVKFGISLDIEVGAVIAKSNTGAALEVELEWARRSDDVLRVLRAETDVESALFTDAEQPETTTESIEEAGC